jgi:hypothetical protein
VTARSTPSQEFPRRTIHLDFHTGPLVPNVGVAFDPDQFADTFKRANVDSVTVFAMCHHGHLYYDTDHPARHPGLSRDLDLLGLQIEALHKVGIRAPIYLSVQCNEYAANTHPDWIALTPELKHVKGGGSAFVPGWQIMDMSSPYQDYFADILSEVLDRFSPVDGIFLDMCWDQPSCSKWAIAGMKKRGYDPRKEEDRNRYAHEVALGYMERYRDMIERAQEKRRTAGIWYNSRPKTCLHQESKYLQHIEIESLPTGGWGYTYFPYVARFVRPLGLPTIGMTGRFFRGWGDNASLKPKMALKYECCQILSQGMSCGVGDLLHPTGALNRATHELIGEVYSYIKACEPYVEGGTVRSQIALIVDPELGDRPGASALGAVRMLQQLRQQFDVLPPDGELSRYELVIIPECTKISPGLRTKLQDRLRSGGALIVCGDSALDSDGNPAMDELGIITHGCSPYRETFIHASEKVADGLKDFGYVMYERGFRMTPAPNSEVLAIIGEPYFQREYDEFSGHDYTPEGHLSGYAAAVKCGRTVVFSVPILEAYGKYAAPNYRILFGNCIDLLLPKPLIRDCGPSCLETSVVQTENSVVVHLISFCPERRAHNLDIVEDAVPIVDMPIEVRVDSAPRRVFLAPAEQDLEYEYRDGYVSTRVTVLDGHAMLVCQC